MPRKKNAESLPSVEEQVIDMLMRVIQTQARAIEALGSAYAPTPERTVNSQLAEKPEAD